MLRIWLTLCLGAIAAATATSGEADFDSKGVKIHYLVEGEGEPVILIHGFIANHNLQWKAPGIVKELAKRRQVIALDARGHGASGKPHDTESYGAEMAEDVVRLMDHLKIQKAHVAGYSMGALITGKLLATHPERLRSAAFGGAAAMLNGPPGDLDVLAESIEKKQSLAPLLRFLSPEGRPALTDEQIAATSRMALSFNDPKALAAVARGMKNLAVRPEQLKGAKVPALVLMGDQDPLKAGIKPFQEAMPALEVFWLKDGDHMNAFVKPDFVKKLGEFFDKVESGEKPLKKAG